MVRQKTADQLAEATIKAFTEMAKKTPPNNSSNNCFEVLLMHETQNVNEVTAEILDVM